MRACVCVLCRAARGIYDRAASAAEIVSVYFEDSRVPPGVVNLSVKKALWPIVQKMNEALRAYPSCTGAQEMLTRCCVCTPAAVPVGGRLWQVRRSCSWRSSIGEGCSRASSALWPHCLLCAVASLWPHCLFLLLRRCGVTAFFCCCVAVASLPPLRYGLTASFALWRRYAPPTTLLPPHTT